MRTLTSEPAGGETNSYNARADKTTDRLKLSRRAEEHPVPTGDVPADVFHPAHVVPVPVGDEDLLDAGVELLQHLFEAADVFRNSRISSVNQHSPGMYSHTFNSDNEVI